MKVVHKKVHTYAVNVILEIIVETENKELASKEVMNRYKNNLYNPYIHSIFELDNEGCYINV